MTQAISPSALVRQTDWRCSRLILPVLITPSETEEAARCDRRHVLDDIMGRHSFSSPSAAFGTVIHQGAEAYWRSLFIDEVSQLEASQLGLDAVLTDFPTSCTGYHTEELARSLFLFYLKTARPFADLPGSWELVSLETRGWFPVSLSDDTLALVGYLTDRRIRRVSSPDEHCIIDLKTASKLSEGWHDSMSHSVQQRVYNSCVLQTPLSETGEPPSKVHTVIEGLQKKGSTALVYVRPSDLWTVDYVHEALKLTATMAERDRLFLDAVSESWIDFQSAEDYAALTDSHSQDDVMPTCFDLSNEDTALRFDRHALELAATETAFNLMDCRSYWFDCDYFNICRSDPSTRLGQLLSYQHDKPRFDRPDIDEIMKNFVPQAASPDFSPDLRVVPRSADSEEEE